MDLGPDMPLTDFTSSLAWDGERIHAMAVYCSDGRWGWRLTSFANNTCELPRYDRLAVPGGPAWLVPSENESGFSQAARQQLDFLVQVHGLERIVLITHYGCAYYGEQLKGSPEECLSAQTADLRRAAETLRDWYPEMQLESFIAMRSGSRLSFHGIRSDV